MCYQRAVMWANLRVTDLRVCQNYLRKFHLNYKKNNNQNYSRFERFNACAKVRQTNICLYYRKHCSFRRQFVLRTIYTIRSLDYSKPWPFVTLIISMQDHSYQKIFVPGLFVTLISQTPDYSRSDHLSGLKICLIELVRGMNDSG